MALNSAQTKAIAYIDEIFSLAKSNRFSSMLLKINSLYLLLYTNKSVLYSNINRYFYKIGVVPILTNYCIYVPNEAAKEILRLLHVFMKINNNIKDVLRTKKFMKYLSTILSSETVWHDIPTFKYHIHVAVYLLMNSESPEDFDIDAIRKIIYGKINENIYSENILLYMICFACTMSIKNSGNIIQSVNFQNMENLFPQIVLKNFVSLIENYLEEFKTFYRNSENRTNQFSFFILETEYTFDQICHSINYYSRLSEKICTNISHSGIYNLVSEILKIEHMPENFILQSLDILSVPSSVSKSNEISKNLMKQENDQNFYSFNSHFLDTNSLSSHNTNNTKQLVNKYWLHESESFNDTENFSMDGKHTLLSIESESKLDSKNFSMNGKHTLSSIESESKLNSKNFSGYSKFVIPINIDEWLTNNRLCHLRIPFSRLTGKGLYQMKTLLKTSYSRIKLIEILITKLDIEVIWALEFLDCLDNLNVF